jgi:phage gpG-like protein
MARGGWGLTMPSPFTLGSMASHFMEIAKSLDDKRGKEAALAACAEIVMHEAKRLIGHPQQEWPPLSAETLAHKEGNTPLLETGELRASIEWDADGREATIGSNNPKAVWHELGTSKVPPRSFLMLALLHKEKEIREVYNLIVREHLDRGHLLREVWDHLKEFVHRTKEFVEDVTEDPNEKDPHAFEKHIGEWGKAGWRNIGKIVGGD